MEDFDSFLERLASPSPAPGGGAASAAVGVIASNLISMVAGLTKGKKGYEEKQKIIDHALERSRILSSEFRNLMAEDEDAFNRLFAAWKMPRTTNQEKEERKNAMEEASRLAIRTPWRIARAAREVITLGESMASSGIASAVTDAGSALEFAFAAIKSAILNIEINIKSMQDKNFTDGEKLKIRLFMEDSLAAYEHGMDTVRRRMTS